MKRHCMPSAHNVAQAVENLPQRILPLRSVFRHQGQVTGHRRPTRHHSRHLGIPLDSFARLARVRLEGS